MGVRKIGKHKGMDERLRLVDLSVKALKEDPKRYFKAHKKFIDSYMALWDVIFRINER